MADDEEPFSSEDIEVAIEDEEGETTVLDSVETVEMEIDEDAEPAMKSWGGDEHIPLPIEHTEFEGSFTVEVDEENAELFETLLAGKAFEDGMSKELADELDTILSDDEDVGAVPPPEKFLNEGSPEVVESLSVDRDQAESLLKVAYQKMNEFQTEVGHLPERLVLGLPQFKAMEAYLQDSQNTSVEESLPVDEVIVVPGPQIHCVRDPYRMVEQSIEEETDESE
jgi:hypothetical protein